MIRREESKKTKFMMVMKYNGQRSELNVSEDIEEIAEGRDKDICLRFELRTF